jgi:hypothetical protein
MEKTLRHNVSNTWQLTRRSEVRFLFGEAHISHFEPLSGLLVNDAAPFISKNVPSCRRLASLRLGVMVHRLTETGSITPFKGKLSVSPPGRARLVNSAPQELWDLCRQGFISDVTRGRPFRFQAARNMLPRRSLRRADDASDPLRRYAELFGHRSRLPSRRQRGVEPRA